MSQFIANIKANLDTSDFSKQIASLNKAGIELSNFKLDATKLVSDIKTALSKEKFAITLDKINNSSISVQMQKSGADAGKSFSNAFNNNISDNGKLDQINEKVNKTKSSLSEAIQLRLDTGDIQTRLDSINTRFNNLGSASQQLKNNIQLLNNAFSTMSSKDSSIEEKTKAYQTFNSLLPIVQRQIGMTAAAEREAAKAANEEAKAVSEAAKAQQLLTKANTLSNEMAAWLNNNSKAAELFGDRIKELQAQLKSDNLSADGLREISLKFSEIKSEAKAAGVATTSFAGSIGGAVKQMLGLGSTVMILQKVVGLVKDGISSVIELDSALVDLQKTAKASPNQLANFYEEANDIAKQYGATTKEIIQTAADWSRLGYNLEESKLMSQYSSMFASISPGVSVDDATSSLVSAMKAFDIQTEDVLDGIMSKVNIVGNSFAVSNADVIEGLQRTSASMSAMGQDIDSVIALFTGANEILQDAAITGTALRSMSLRIRGFDEETEQLSEDLVGLSGKIIDLTKTANKPMGVSIWTDETQTKYKDFIDYFRELSEVWKDMSAANQTALLNDLFGKRGAQAGSALIKNFETVEAAITKMQNSAGNAEAEMEIIVGKQNCLYVQRCA